MGNHQFKVANNPQRGQICTIVDSSFSAENKFPKNVYGQGAKVKVIGTQDLLCSRPTAPKVTVSIVQFSDGRQDVYPSNNLKPI